MPTTPVTDTGPALLVVGPSWVGDMVMAQSLFKVLAAENSEAIIDVVAPAWSMPLLTRMEEVAASPEDRFLAWHCSGEPLPLDRAIRDHARAAKQTVAVSTAERYGQFAERVVGRIRIG